MPFQAVRVRITLQNISKERIGPLRPLEDVVRAPTVKGPEDGYHREYWAGFPPEGVQRSNVYPMITWTTMPAAMRTPHYLDVGERVSITTTFPMSRAVRNKGSEFQFLAPEPGRYSLKYHYPVGGDWDGRDRVIEQTIEIQVRPPRGDDKIVFELLQKDLRVVSALLSSGTPVWDVAPTLKEIIEKYPHSSYADYARLAFAKLLHHAPAADLVRPISFYRLDEKHKKLVTGQFAYQPQALILLKKADPKLREEALRHLDRHFTDSREWIEERARILASSDPKDRPELELLGVKFNDPFTTEKPSDIIDTSAVERWESFRKRRPARPEKQPDR